MDTKWTHEDDDKTFYIPDFLSDRKCRRVIKHLAREIEYVPREQITFSIFGKTMPVPRDKAFFGDVKKDGSYPLYRYSGSQNYPAVLGWTKKLKKLVRYIKKKLGYEPNHLVINRYQDGSDHIGWHQDKYRDFVDGTPIITISLGQVRNFQVRSLEDKKNIKSFQLKSGSAFVLGYDTNMTHKHRIAKTAKKCDVRYSLTFRCIKNIVHC